MAARGPPLVCSPCIELSKLSFQLSRLPQNSAAKLHAVSAIHVLNEFVRLHVDQLDVD